MGSIDSSEKTLMRDKIESRRTRKETTVAIQVRHGKRLNSLSRE